MRIAVTGGAGFVGSHVVEHFVAQGHTLLVVDNLSHGLRAHVPPGVAFHHDDIRSAESQAKVRSFQPQAVVHLAAQMSVTDSMTKPIYDAEVNLIGTMKMAEAARDGGAQAFVFASSGGALYGDTNELPATENTAVLPLSPYGLSKWSAESYLERFYGQQSDSMRCVSLRLSNVFGPRQSNAGEGGVISIFAQQMVQPQATPKIYGDGKQTRDFVYVKDVVDAITRAIDTPARGVFNIGTGKQTSLIDLTDTLRGVTHFCGLIEHMPARAGEVRFSCLSANKAATQLGWRPQVSLHQGLLETVRSLSDSESLRAA